ncbi:MAG: response regulator [Pseudomonadales bacterium]|nr:response regulator [Pseudomonadales bacterium]
MKRNLATRLAVYTILLAIVIGALVSTITIYVNYSRTVSQLENTASQLLELTLDSARSAVFQLDPELADNVLTGLMQYPLFVQVTLFDELGGELASISRPGRPSQPPLENLINVPVREFSYELPLDNNDSQSGRLVALVDIQQGLSGFYNQSILTASAQILMAVVLAIIIFLVVVYLVTTPLSQLAAKLAATHPGSESKLAVDSRHANDELGLLADSANKYLGAAYEYQQELEESGKRLQNILDNLREGVLLVDSDGRVVESNKAAEAMFAYDAEQFQGLYLPSLVQKAGYSDYGELLMDVSRHSQTGLRCQASRTNGSSFLVELSVSPFTAQRLDQTLWTIRDLSEQEEVERQRHELEEQLRQSQKMEAIGTLAGGIAHDFNNILAGINGFAELALVNEQQGKSTEKNINQILRASNKAAQLVQRILTFSRKQKENRQLFNLADVASESVDLVRQTIPASIEVNADLGDQAYPIFGDESMMHQVLMNLFTNAAGALKNEPGEIRLTMQVIASSQSSREARSSKSRVRIVVEDSGPGIPESILPRIFEPYFTTKEQGEGTGIGLAMVHSIINSHGGKIKAENSGRGARFVIDLPLYEGAALPISEKQQKQEVGVVGRAEQILLVEDNEMLAEMFPELLESLGYEVELARDGQEALDLYQANREKYDLVITDQTMPRMNGDKLIRAIFELDPEQPIILCTGYSDVVDRENVLAMGVKSFLNKPLTLDEIRQAIQEALAA